MAIKIILAVVSFLDVLLLLCVVSLNTRLKLAEKFMDDRYVNAYNDITGKSGKISDEEKQK